MARPVRKYCQRSLQEALTLPERYSWDAMMDNARVAKWLGTCTTTVQRWRALGTFPPPCGRVSSVGRRGGRPRGPWEERKGLPAWRPITVIRWLRSTGRLEVS